MTRAFGRHGPILAALAIVAAGSPAGAEDATTRGGAVQSATPPGSRAPDGNGCSGAIARWQSEQGSEYAGGNVSLTVYNEIQNEIDRAVTACEAGQDAQARKIMADAKRRHGHPQ